MLLGLYMAKIHILAHRHIDTQQKEQKSPPETYFYKDTNPIHELPTPVT